MLSISIPNLLCLSAIVLFIVNPLGVDAARRRPQYNQDEDFQDDDEDHRPRRPPREMCPRLASIPGTSSAPQCFSTESPYKPPRNSKSTKKGCPGCQLVQVQLIARNGAQYPEKDTVTQFKSLERVLKRVQNRKFGWMSSFINGLVPTRHVGKLHRVGEKELEALAKRDRQRYAPHMSRNVLKRTKVYAINCPSAKESAQGYLSGMFGPHANKPRISLKKKNQDTILNPGDMCPAYKGAVQRSVSNANRDLGRVVQPVVQRISKQLGVKLNLKQILVLARLCAAGVTLCKARGAFCNVFQKEDLKRLSFYQDTMFWYKHAAGSKINVDMAGTMLKALVDEMKSVASKSKSKKCEPNFVLRFGDASTISRLGSLLSLYKKKPCLDDKKAFQASTLVPFGANIHLELWKKQSRGHGPPPRKNKGRKPPRKDRGGAPRGEPHPFELPSSPHPFEIPSSRTNKWGDRPVFETADLHPKPNRNIGSIGRMVPMGNLNSRPLSGSLSSRFVMLHSRNWEPPHGEDFDGPFRGHSGRQGNGFEQGSRNDHQDFDEQPRRPSKRNKNRQPQGDEEDEVPPRGRSRGPSRKNKNRPPRNDHEDHEDFDGPSHKPRRGPPRNDHEDFDGSPRGPSRNHHSRSQGRAYGRSRGPPKFSGYSIRLLYNEQPLKIPRCSNMFCPLDEFIHHFQAQINRPLKQVCRSRHRDY